MQSTTRALPDAPAQGQRRIESFDPDTSATWLFLQREALPKTIIPPLK
jgi:hypothetical protein